MALVTDPVTLERVTVDELLARERERANEKLQEEVTQRNSQGTERNSKQRVKTLTKGASRSFIGGGATVYNAEVNNTDFIPSDTSEPNQSLPDYYRNGRLINQTVTLPDGETVNTQVYAPIAEQISAQSDSYRGVLASIRLIDPRKIKGGNPSSSNPREGQLVPEFSKFFLESVQESHNEKFQLVETFNDFYVYFYGEKPPIYTFSGHLLNLLNYNWKNEFMYFYENFWRGTKAVELGARIFLTYDYQQIQGYILGINTNLQSLTDKAANFSFTVLVTKRLFFNGTADDGVVRDNLIPRSDNGFINTTANSFSQALTAQYLNGDREAASAELASADNSEKGKRLLANNASSTRRQEIPNPSFNPLSTLSRGAQKATGLVRNLGVG